MTRLKIIFILLIFPVAVFSQTKKEIVAVRTTTAPIIDGDLSDTIWEKAPVAKEFIQFQPDPGKVLSQKTEVKILYDDKSIYVYAKNYDSSPDSISKQLTKRDDSGIADWFGIMFDTFNDDKMSYGFSVTAAGVQTDKKILDGGGEDYNWDAVWKSEVKINSDGWDVEFKIPYSALRFPKKDVQQWKVNMFRYIGRNREIGSWNEVDPSQNNINLKNGVLKGISDIKSPVRLSLRPFVATYAQKYDNENFNMFFKGGMDLKYGINESFTLDMMLIPDFGQVQSDDKRLNLSPFELYYSEKRAFFTEGTELFNRAGVFYSRRIGGTPEKYYDIYNELSSSEKVISNPTDLRMLNVTKISGKTEGGLSVGFLNGMTLKSVAQIEDTVSGNIREFVTQNFTNYNVTAVEQTLKNSSYISLVNTNYAIADNEYISNVTGTDFKIANKAVKYAVFGKGAINYNKDSINNTTTGYSYQMRFSKISGNFQFSLRHLVMSDTYDNNDMGYLTRNNEQSELLSLSYRTFEPKGKFLNTGNYLSYNRVYLFNPRKYARSQLSYNINGTTLNYLSFGLSSGVSPEDNYNYYEPRVEGRFVITPPDFYIGTWGSTNYNKKIAVDFNIGIWKAPYYKQDGMWVAFSPRFRINDKIMIFYSNFYEGANGGYGFVETNSDNSIIYFGRRDVRTYTNTLKFNYMYNNKISLSLRARHFRSTVNYTEFVTLNDDGRFSNPISDYTSDNVNFNAFNIDMTITGEFAPGSFISLVWKNEIYSSDTNYDIDYFSDFSNTMKEPQTNTISLKIIYYLDYLYLQRKNKL